MQISFSITADSAEEMDQKLDVALFKLGKNREQILRLAVDEQIEIDQVTVFRSE
jgi:hypothetical protein